MSKTLKKTTRDTVTYGQALQMINKGNGTNYTTVALAVAALTIGVAVTFFTAGVGPVIVATLNAVSITLGAAAVIDTLRSNYQTQLANAISQLRSYSYIIITTNTYDNYSGSGNSWWLSTEHSFAVHHDSN